MRLVVNPSNPWSLSDTELLGVAPAADRCVYEEATKWIVAEILSQDIPFRRPNQEQWLFGEREHGGGGSAFGLTSYELQRQWRGLQGRGDEEACNDEAACTREGCTADAACNEEVSCNDEETALAIEGSIGDEASPDTGTATLAVSSVTKEDGVNGTHTGVATTEASKTLRSTATVWPRKLLLRPAPFFCHLPKNDTIDGFSPGFTSPERLCKESFYGSFLHF